ncbi:hypothetical protein [Tahibacter amnicola]|uniref:Aspartyl protease n=1 Tax=Tahibacter amnicola TaxID=2976241 RepID=A0ABY6BFP3_9GAMM|nr:hypothetical protein [Tahibacter amnicola]UXI68589.1 hypothetical protein N4264_02750 [Tahibacter amnicola]
MKSISTIVAAVAGVFAPVALALEPLADVPLASHDFGLAMIEVQFDNDVRMTCALDSGAERFGVLPLSVVRRAGVEADSRVIEFINGSKRTLKTAIASMRLSDATSQRGRFNVMDLRLLMPDGQTRESCLVGIDYLRAYTVDIDGIAGRFRLWPKGTRIDTILGPGRNVVMASWNDLPRVGVVVDGQNVNAAIDTGSYNSHINKPLGKRLNVREGDPRLGPLRARDGTKYDGFTLPMLTVASFMLGDADLAGESFSYGDKLRVSNTWSSKPAVWLGWRSLRAHRTLFDFANDEMRVVPAPARSR